MRPRMAELLRLVVSAAIPVATVVLFATLAVFTGNTREFASAYASLLVRMLPYALAVFAVLTLAGLLVNGDARKRYLAILNALAVLFWLQGNILVWQYGALDGSTIHWLDNAWRGVLDSALWVLLLAVAIFGFRRFGKGLFFAAVATFCIQAIASVPGLGRHPEIYAVDSVAGNAAGRAAAMQFSSEFNIVHIVMDGFQSDIFAAILADTSERDFRQELRGFTYFEQHLGAYPYTQLTVPAMLSGKLYYNDQPVDDFISQSIGGPTITNSAFASGYEVDIMATVPLRNTYAVGQHNNAYGITSDGHVTADDLAVLDAAKLIDLALFRVAPHFGKALVHRDELWVFQGMVQSRSYLHLQYFSDLAFLDSLKEEMSVSRDTPVYKLMHFMLSHRPFVGNARCEYDGRKTGTREAVITHAQCGLLGVLGVLQRMKDLGIYDSSLIVLMADHGAWVPVENVPQSGEVTATAVGMATPTLAIKPPGAMHPFRSSPAPSSMVDIAATIAALAGIDAEFPGQSVFSLDATAPRERRHLTYGYGVNPDAEGYLFPMQEWRITGNPYDPASWTRGELFNPGSRREH